MLGPIGNIMNEMTNHEFDEKDVCRHCACSKAFVLRNNIVCTPLPKDERYYMLQYRSIFDMFDRLRESGLAENAENVRDVFKKIHFMGDIPIDKLDWWIDQWGKHRKEFYKIYLKGIESQLKNPDAFVNSTYMDRYWKDPQWT